ncbi:MAG TPA: ABC transporter ATP-binding protein [Ramlibacter sp.]|nr:ABC transporter ATP-binding protein [Ramlibacter sp.]
MSSVSAQLLRERTRALPAHAGSHGSAPAIEFKDVLTELGGQVIYDHISFSVQPGEFVCILGPSGCGKSTALRLMGGLLQADAGTVRIAGSAPVDGWSRIAYVFQSPRLAPWRTALGNVMLALELRTPQTKAQHRERAREMLQLVGLAHLADQYPGTMSGGERQRVALARALAVDPEIILMDEPFSALDPNTRHALRGQLLDLWSHTGKTIVFVTHDIDEALTLADRVLMFSRKPTRLDRVMEIRAPRPRRINDSPELQARNKELVDWFVAMGAHDELTSSKETS